MPLAIAIAFAGGGNAFSAPVLFPNGDFSAPEGADWGESFGGAQAFNYPSSGGNTSGGGAGDGYGEIVSSEGGGWAVLITNSNTPLDLATLGLVAGETYEFSYDMRASVTGGNKGGIKLESWTATDAISDTGDLRVTAATTDWETHTVTYTIAATATHIKAVPLWTPNETVGFDNIQVDNTPIVVVPQVHTWDGNDAAWETASEWDLDGVPNVTTFGDSAVINAGTSTYNATGGDFRLNSSLTVGGTGTWTQSAAGNWIKIGDGTGQVGTITVNSGGTFDTGGGTGFFLGFAGGTADMTVDGGTVNVSSNFEVNDGSSLTLNSGMICQSGGLMFVRDADGVSVSGGTLKVFRLVFDGTGATVLDFSGGLIHVTDVGVQGIDSQSAFDRYLDFTGSDGTFFLEGGVTADAQQLIDDGRISRNGLVEPTDFAVFERNGGVEISLANVSKTITATASAGGVISPSGPTTVAYDGSQTFTITPDSGFSVTDVTVDGVSVGVVSSYTFDNVISSRTIEATFLADDATFDITASAGPNGSISPAGVTSVPFEGDQTYTITPNLGYDVKNVLVDGVSVGRVTSYTFTDVGEEHSISVEFKLEGTEEFLLDFGTGGGSGPVFTGTFDGSTGFVPFEIANNGVTSSPSQDLGGGVTLTFTNVSGWNNSNGDPTNVSSLNGDHLFSSALGADDPVSFTLSGVSPSDTVLFEILDRTGAEDALVTFDGLTPVVVNNETAFTDVSEGGVTGKSSYTGTFTDGTGAGEGNIAAARIRIFPTVVGPEPIELSVTEVGGQLEFVWHSSSGLTYDLVSSTDLSTPVSTWSAYNDGSTSYVDVPSGGAMTTLSNVAMAGEKRFFAVVEKPALD